MVAAGFLRLNTSSPRRDLDWSQRGFLRFREAMKIKQLLSHSDLDEMGVAPISKVQRRRLAAEGRFPRSLLQWRRDAADEYDAGGERDFPPHLQPNSVAWDIFRIFGADEGFSVWVDFIDVFEGCDDELSEEYLQEKADLWKTFDRERTDSDALLIDVFDDFAAEDWTPPAEINASIERLRDVAAAVREAEAERRKVKPS
jgi:hypothetical protein